MASFKAMDEEHPMLEMPDIESEHAAGYIIGLLQEAGLMSSNGMGPVPISWQEISNWLSVTGTEIGVWEKLIIKSLSEEYVSELIQANEPNRAAPYTKPSPEEIERARIADKIMNTLSKFIRR